MNNSIVKNLVAIVLWSLFSSLFSLTTFAGSTEGFPFHLPKGAGTFRLGIVKGNESRWMDECSLRRKGELFTIKNALLAKGEITLIICPLADTDGFIVEVQGKNLPTDMQLCWAFGGCNDTFGKIRNTSIPPEACRDNVFSDEGQAVTMYYGKVMGLRVIQGVTPPNQGMILADARHQESPLALYQSGKQTDVPVLTALCPWKNGEKLYFCFYKQNGKADYNYFMLPELFARSLKKVASVP